jgi:hypothetical protein
MRRLPTCPKMVKMHQRAAQRIYGHVSHWRTVCTYVLASIVGGEVAVVSAGLAWGILWLWLRWRMMVMRVTHNGGGCS